MIHREPKIESKLHQRLLVAWWGLVIYLALVGDYWVLQAHTTRGNLRGPLCDGALAAGFHAHCCRDLQNVVVVARQ